MLLKDKVAIVSGVGPGLGRATALALAREGASVGLAARTSERVQAVAEEIEALGGRAIPLATNIVDADECARVVAQTIDAFGGLDILVNNAFRGDGGASFADADLNEWRKVFEVNVWGSLQLTQAAVPALKKRGGGSVVFVNSMSARKIRSNEGSYASSKGALLVAARSLATELGSDGIRVNSVIPGWIWGPNVQYYVDWQIRERGLTKDEVIAEITDAIPLGFIPPQEDIAEAILFFASDMSRVITGQSLDVNGGEYFGV